MGVTTESALSVQLYEGTAAAGQYLSPRHAGVIGVRVASFSFTQSAAAGDATSVQRLLVLPPGKIKVLGIYLANSAFGASRVLDVGYEAFAQTDGTAVSASATAFNDDLDVAAQGARMTWYNTALDSKSGIVIKATVAGGTIPAAATLAGYFLLAA